MFLSAGEQVSVRNLLHGIVTLSGNDASVVLAECIAGTEEGYAARMNALATLPSTSGAKRSTSTPASARNPRASST